jgi:hypothetical protein
MRAPKSCPVRDRRCDAHELSEKYRDLYQRSKELVDEAAAMAHRASNTAKNQLR